MSIDVLFATDGKYWAPTYIALVTMLKRSRARYIRVFIICQGIDRKFDAQIEILKKRDRRLEVNFLNVSVSLRKFDSLKTRGHLSRATYFRFLLGDLLPESCNKVIYLDSDIIVLGPLEELYGEKLAGMDIGAVDVMIPDKGAHLGFAPEDGYFNAGVLLVDVALWREKERGEELLRYCHENREVIQWPSNDPLNAVFKNNWVRVHPKFNFYHGFMGKEYFDDLVPTIVHFSGSRKPWHLDISHEYSAAYLRELLWSPYKGVFSKAAVDKIRRVPKRISRRLRKNNF